MRTTAAALLLCGVAAASVAASPYPTFEAWTKAHGKAYSAEEHLHRARVFGANVAMVRTHNEAADAGVHTWRMEVNKFADMSKEEFAAVYLGLRPLATAGLRGADAGAVKNWVPPALRAGGPLPATFDWQDKPGTQTPVKNQEQCGSCWAFSTVESIESAVAISGGKLQALSPQQLVDCADAYNNAGCDGGNQNWAYRYVIKTGGLCTEADYPYKGTDGKCKASTCALHSPINSFAWPIHQNVTIMKAAILRQPVSIGVNAENWQFYGSGVYNDNCDGGIDHAVIASGYIMEHGKLVWAVRNSWGAGWGHAGYIWLNAEHNLPHGVSCILDQPIIPLVGGPKRNDDHPGKDMDDPWTTNTTGTATTYTSDT